MTWGVPTGRAGAQGRTSVASAQEVGARRWSSLWSLSLTVVVLVAVVVVFVAVCLVVSSAVLFVVCSVGVDVAVVVSVDVVVGVVCVEVVVGGVGFEVVGVGVGSGQGIVQTELGRGRNPLAPSFALVVAAVVAGRNVVGRSQI